MLIILVIIDYDNIYFLKFKLSNNNHSIKMKIVCVSTSLFTDVVLF